MNTDSKDVTHLERVLRKESTEKEQKSSQPAMKPTEDRNVDELTKMMKNLVLSSQKTNETLHKLVFCQNCGKLGHIRSRCYANQPKPRESKD
ncbi:hypothetical protein BB560_007284 [Smittium megazygosporum]|uniref:CCHC-type domain-containing protein n=1 Tax=Smittium megazygosporum TaxID=133381 RepID=A0A2T9XXA8_9FUNG|nr:hypothetical protein BB560_007284 [Smittium megazygosporum]